MIHDLRLTIKRVLLLALFFFALRTPPSALGTPCIYSANNFLWAYGFGPNPLTNAISIQPVYSTQVTIYGTNLITGAAQTVNPDTNGVAQFNLYPNSYLLQIAGLNYSLPFNVPDQTNVLNIGLAAPAVGTYTYTNNSNFRVNGSPGDNYPGTLTEKILAANGLLLTTNNVGGNLCLQLALPAGLLYANATNTVMTALGAQINGASNVLESQIYTFLPNGTNNIGSAGNPYGTQNNIAFGGTNNTWPVWPAYNSAIIGGRGNQVSGQNVTPANEALGIFCGIGDLIQWPCWNSQIIGGMFDTLSANTGTVIVGGTNCTAGGFGYFNLVLGGYKNQVGGCSYSIAAGAGAVANQNSTFVWSDSQGLTNNFTTTAPDEFLIRARGGVGINTNNPGTNALEVAGNADFANASISGVSMFTLFSTTAVSNALSVIWNYNLNSVSNALQVQITAVSNATVTASNTLAARLAATNAALVALVQTTSNSFAANIGPAKALTATVPATYSSIGIGFSTPLMPDGNYSVTLTPQDQATAEAPLNGIVWWVGSKNASGFTIYTTYATNAYNLNFECQVKENTQ